MIDCVFCKRILNREYDYKYSVLDTVQFEPLNPVVPGHMLFVNMVHTADVLQAALLAEGNGVSLHDPDTRIFTRASKAFERYRFREGDRVLESGDIPADQRDFINRNLDMYQLKIGKYGILEKRD